MDFSSVISKKILSSTPVYGGDIGRSFRVKTVDDDYFVKRYSAVGIAAREAAGLAAMAGTGAVKVPELINYDEHFLVLRFISEAPRCSDFQQRLGRELALMHRTTSPRFGFPEDDFVGRSPQKNSWKDSWLEFYLENRLDYQVELTGDRDIERTYRKLRSLIPGLLEDTVEEPSLIHGDLWAGNVISGPEGEPVLIDPAAYFGHREAELGMTMLFGGFSEAFYAAYDDEFPLKAGWRGRMDLYKLYHVLNHMNLFGGGYKQQAISLMNYYL